jgi:glycosyltransferase involved in cell wall biosynthesis
MSTDYLLAINALRKDFRKISYGPWIKNIVLKLHNLGAASIPFFIDKQIYSANARVARSNDLIVYFARPEMPRRCFDLGVTALRLFQEKYGNAAKIVLFGSNAVRSNELFFDHSNLGVLSRPELAALYRKATLGLAFSPTNPSMVPFEMMACGLPVIDLDVDGNELNYGGRENAFLVAPDPLTIAEGIRAALEDAKSRRRVAENGQAFALSLPSEWEATQHLVRLITADNWAFARKWTINA